MLDDTSKMVYEYIRTYIHEHGYAPSQRDIATGCYINVASVMRYLDRLEAKAYIRREPNKARSITICEAPKQTNV